MKLFKQLKGAAASPPPPPAAAAPARALAPVASAPAPAAPTAVPAEPQARIHRGDERFLKGVHAAQAQEALPRVTWALYLMAIVVVVALVWSSLVKVDEVTRAEARVVPDGKEQLIASLEGGILREMYVREGMLVQEGQELAQLDPTRVEAAQSESQTKRMALKATIARLKAEASGKAIDFPSELKDFPALREAETDSFVARRHVLDDAVAGISRNIGLLNKELSVAQGLSARGLMSEVEVMRLVRQINDLQQARSERLSRFRQDAVAELTRLQTELAQLDDQAVVRDDQLSRTVLKSPVKGFVKNIRINTIGGVVGPGAPVMEIVPVGPRILVEAKLKPKDVGFIRLGQQVEVKLSAYDYTTYGGLKGKVDYISPDAIGDADRPGAAEQTFYRAMIKADRSTLKQGGKPLPVIPGMTAVVEVKTGERSVLSFLVSPMLKSQEAFRER